MREPGIAPPRVGLPSFTVQQVLGGGLRLPARMTVLTLTGGRIALISPIPIDAGMAAELACLGDVRYLIAPNLLHHLYLGDAMRRYPGARVLAPAGLARKRPDLRIDRALETGLPLDLSSEVGALCIEGAPTLDEHVFFHRATATLVVTDLVFRVLSPEGWRSHLVLHLVGCHGRLAMSRMWRLFSRDRAATARSLEALLALPFDSLIMAHGEPLVEGAHAALADALRAFVPDWPSSSGP